MFDIGVPELAVIAIVALVVLGPERLPEVMKQAGKWYRQAMNFRAELMTQVADAQRTFREEMEAVERAATVNLNEVAPETVLPPPALLQVPSYRRQPDKAHDAGPFGLPAWYRDTSPDVDVPAHTAALGSPLALIRTVGDTLLGNAYVTSTRTLVAPVHPFDDPHDPSGVPGQIAPLPLPDPSAATCMRTPDRGIQLEQPSDDERRMREGTVVTLYEAGLHTKESAAGALEIPVSEFDRLLAARLEASEVTVV